MLGFEAKIIAGIRTNLAILKKAKPKPKQQKQNQLNKQKSTLT